MKYRTALANGVRRTSAVVAVILLITAVYGPARGLGLVWDDKILLHDTSWLRHGDEWLKIAFHGLADWTNYFRPVGIALFAIEARFFDASAAPMHLLSLGLHLVNTLLVGALARNLLTRSSYLDNATLLSCVAMLFFGLHPVLVEPVAWISSQCELLVTFFMLLGLLANAALRNEVVRALAVATCFFLAACAKESAIAFPVLIFVADWALEGASTTNAGDRQSGNGALRACLRRQWLVYLSLLLAGIAYLSFRYWGLGFLVSDYGQAVPFSWSRLQLVCYTYLTYWRLLIWPMTGLGPIHIVPDQQFNELTAMSLAIDVAAGAIVSLGVYLFWIRKPLGALIVGVTIALFPVLHILPVEFDESAFHDRYAMTALGFACALLPMVVANTLHGRSKARISALCLTSLATVWLLLAIVNIRVTLPLWSDEVRLWEWALRKNPGSVVVEDHLLSAYLDNNDMTRAQLLADVLERDGRSCPNCMINVAYLAVNQGDAARATSALQEAKSAMDKLVPVRSLIVGYILTSGNLSQLQHDPAEAERAYNAAISIDPLNPNTHMSLAYLQARQGRSDEARRTAETGLSLCAEDDQMRRRLDFEQVLAAATSISTDASSSKQDRP